MLLDEMEIFYYVSKYQSFSKAAQHLNVSKSYISKKITLLEKSLKTHLISRNTRKLTLSEAGQTFYQHCSNIVQEGNEAYSMIQKLKSKPSGILKISLPPALGLNLISPLLSKFLKHYPEMILDIQMENRIIDILEEGYDLALRSAASLASSNLIAQKILSIKSTICAHEKYLRVHGTPKIAHDLEQHNFATYRYLKKIDTIRLIKNNREENLPIQGNFTSNHLDLIKQMVLSGVCIALLPEFMVGHEIEQGLLKRCLPSYQLPESPLYAIYPERKFMPPKLKAFLEALKNYLSIKSEN